MKLLANICLTLVYCLVFITDAKSQSRYDEGSTYKYVYRIYANEVADILEKSSIENLTPFLHSLVDSFPSNSKWSGSTIKGYYLVVGVYKKEIKLEIKSYFDYKLDILENYRDLIIKVIDCKKGLFYEEAEVFVGNRKIRYDSKLGAFRAKYINRNGLLIAHVGLDTLVYSIRRHSYILPESENKTLNIRTSLLYRKLSLPFRMYNYRLNDDRYFIGLFRKKSQDEIRYKGYMAFNKPIYRPGDSLMLKCYITNLKGKKFNGPIEIWLKESRRSMKLCEKIEVRNGSLEYGCLIPDSIQLDIFFNLEVFNYKDKRKILSERVYLEDYQLNENTFSFSSVGKEFKRGDTIELLLSGVSASQLRLADAKVKIVAYNQELLDYAGDTIYFPDRLWEHETDLEFSTSTSIFVPDSILPKAKMNIMMEATFTNSNNEIQKKDLFLFYDGMSEDKVEFKLNRDSLQIVYYKNNRSVQEVGTLIAISRGTPIDSVIISLPIVLKYNPAISNYVFVNTKCRQTFSVQSDPSVSCYFKRNADSLYFMIHNPLNLEVSYFLYRNKNHLLEKGNLKTLEKTIIDNSDASYFITIHYLWGGLVHDLEYSIYHPDKLLDVEIEQPNEVFPGQEINVIVTVKDSKNKPLAGVDVLAGSVNSQFNRWEVPDIPYFGKIKNRGLIPIEYLISNDYPLIRLPLTYKNINFFHLDSSLYFKINFPGDSLIAHYLNFPNKESQFAPFIVNNGMTVPIKLIYLDGKIVYVSESDANLLYSFKGAVGYHSLRIRTAQAEYYIDSIELMRHKKLLLSFDISRLPGKVAVKKLPPHYLKVEADAINKVSFRFDNHYRNVPIHVWQADRYFQLQNAGIRTINIAPINLVEKLNYAVHDLFITSFYPEKDFLHQINFDIIKMFSKSAWIKENQSFLTETSNISLYDTALDPMNLQLQSNLQWYSNVRFTHNDNSSNCLFHCTNNVKGDFVVTILENQDDSSYSLIRPYDFINESFLNPGRYKVLLITSEREVFESRSVTVPSSGHLYFKLDSLSPRFKTIPNLNLSEQYRDSLSKRSFLGKSGSRFGHGRIIGQVLDGSTDGPIPFAYVTFSIQGGPTVATSTDFDGFFSIDLLTASNYQMKVSFVGYDDFVKRDIDVEPGRTISLSCQLYSKIEVIDQVEVYSMPYIYRRHQTSTAKVHTVKDISELPLRTLQAVVNTSLSMLHEINYQNDKNVYKISESPDIRKDFSDFAYWKPILYSNEKGQVSFKAKFPDNLTTWNSYALAMGPNKTSGRGFIRTRAVKPVTSELASPRFLLVGDTVLLIGKTITHKLDLVTLRTQFIVDNNPGHDSLAKINRVRIETLPLIAANKDSVLVSYLSYSGDTLMDGELRHIPIFPVGVLESKGFFYTLSGDTLFNISVPNENSTWQMYAKSTVFDVLFDEIDKLRDYPYSCTEQISSKLRGLLVQKAIQNQMKAPFKHDFEIKKLIDKLKKGMKDSGGWGWFVGAEERLWMTCYVVNTLIKAESQGFYIGSLQSTRNNLIDRLDFTYDKDLLLILKTLKNLKENLNYSRYIAKINVDSLDVNSRLMLADIRSLTDTLFNYNDIFKDMNKTIYGSPYWGTFDYYFGSNDIASTQLAYQIIERMSPDHPMLDRIPDFFLERKSGYGWRNTLEVAGIVETILPRELKKYSNGLQNIKSNSLRIDDTDIRNFPYKGIINSTDRSINIQKSGYGTIYLSLFEKKWNSSPRKDDSLFSISSWFETNGITSDTLIAGVPVKMKVSVKVKRKSEYIMLEIPIPAGCSYDKKTNNHFNYETHREYFKNKTCIFLENLPQGIYTFEIYLQPRFTGVFTLNPARAESMYFSVLSGQNESRCVSIINER